MKSLKVGMYVRCPIVFDEKLVTDAQKEFPRDFLLGQITNVNQEFDKVKVNFYSDEYLAAFCNIPKSAVYNANQVVRCDITEGETVSIHDHTVSCVVYHVCASKDKDDYKKYVVVIDGKNYLFEESKLKANVNQGTINPAKQMCTFELNNPQWYKSRCEVSETMQYIDNAPYGFKTLLGTRTYLYSHQIDTIIRVMVSKDCRYMLADEVGLGKTIEACTIIKGLSSQFKKPNVLFIVPDSLIYQWKSELSGKFWMNVPICGQDSCDQSHMMLIAQEKLNNPRIAESLVNQKWDICLVDETHRLISNSELYKVIFTLSKQVSHMLLLSATPITKMRNEYHKLLSLLNPDRYSNMSEADFNELMEKQKTIQNYVYDMMSDLPDYLEYDLYDDYSDTLNEIAGMIQDANFNSILEQIQPSSEDRGLSQIKLALAYLSEFYQIDRNIIRHRRSELQEEQIQRDLRVLKYEMQDVASGHHDYETYEAVLSYVSYLTQNFHGNESVHEYIRDLLCAVFGSPYAVLSLLGQRSHAEGEEKEHIDFIEKLAKMWISEQKHNLFLQTPSKEKLLIDYLKENEAEKLLIFTGFAETAEHLEQILRAQFGKESVVSFHENKSREESQEAADLFQINPNCKYMVCDESGGEGRNFQIADEIIHFDLPLSPFKIEQRIGRLDRIGRKSGKDVLSVVLISENSIESDIFNIYNEGLNVFKESLCGLEIVLEQIQNKITSAIENDIRNGLRDIVADLKNDLNVMRKEVEKERYFDLARQFNVHKLDNYMYLIRYFSENDGERLIGTMLNWAKMVGYLGIHLDSNYEDDFVFSVDTNPRRSFNMQCAKNALYFPPKMDDIISHSKIADSIYGTFSRETALKFENLSLFAPGNNLYDSIVTNAVRSYRGRCTALRDIHSEVDAKIIKMIFNVKFNPMMLIKAKISLNMLNLIKQYIVKSQISIYYDIEQKVLTADEKILEATEAAIQSKTAKHLGKRGNGAVKLFKAEVRSNWIETIKNACTLGKEEAKKESCLCVRKDYAIEQLENKFNAMQARKLYFNENDDLDDFNAECLGVLEKTLESLKVELDSIAYIEMNQEMTE